MQTPKYPEPIPDETIANLVHQHLVTDSPPSEQQSDSNHQADCSALSRSEYSGRPTEEIAIPYHLPGVAITHDIYTHANSLIASGSLQRSKSTADLNVRGGKLLHKDDLENDPVMENLTKPGGFRRYHVQQQQQQQQRSDSDSPSEVDDTDSPAFSQLFRPLSVSSMASTNYSALLRSDSVAKTATIDSLRNIPTRHFLEYLAITSVLDRFAGEDLSDSEDEDESEENAPLLDPQQRKKRRAALWKKRRRLLSGGNGDDYSSLETAERGSKNKANAFKTALLLFKAFISSGILFLPKAFSNGGLGFSIVTLYFMGAISLYCFLLLLECKEQLHGSYGDIGGALYGPWMRRLVLFSIAISQVTSMCSQCMHLVNRKLHLLQLGFTCGGTIFIVQNIAQAVRSLSHHAIQLNTDKLLILVAALLMPLVLIRNIAKLSPAALSADILIVLGLLILLACDVYQIFVLNTADGVPTVGPDIQWWLNPTAYPVFIGTAVYSFEGIGLIIPICDAMEKPKQFPMVLTATMIFIATVLCAVGSLGYLAFGSNVQTVALLNLPEGPLGSTVQLGYALAVHLTNPLALFPTIRIVEQALFGEKTGKHNPSIKWQKNALRCSVVITCALIAWGGANDLDKFISLIGSICCCKFRIEWVFLLFKFLT